MGFWGKYISVAEKKAQAEKKLKALKKKNPTIKPVTVEGRNIAKTWWGKEWNKNLERYADYANRIGRGRSYVRHGAVLDLQIEPGKVDALVQGSTSKPYSVTINIKKMDIKNWNALKKACKGNMDSLHQLREGKFPKVLENLFTEKGKGLFPTPSEIGLSCSCPDWATMCKHVAAVLYGIGARLDEDPELFFILRKANMSDLIYEAVNEGKKHLQTKAAKKTSRVIDDSSLSDLFGIDLVEDSGSARKLPALKKADKKRNIRKTAKPGSSAPKPIRAKRKKPSEPVDMVRAIIKRHKKGIRVSDLIEKTDIDPVKVRNIVFKLKNAGEIENVSRGIYKKTG